MFVDGVEVPYQPNEPYVPPYRYNGKAKPQFLVTYVSKSGVTVESEIYVHRRNLNEQGGPTLECWCFSTDAPVNLHNREVLSVINLKTGRPIKDLGKYLLSYR